MRRRKLVTALGGAVLWPIMCRAQQPPGLPTVGFLSLGWERDNQRITEGLRSGLTALGYAESKNIRVVYRFANGNPDHLPALTAELASLGAAVIVTSNTTTIRAAHNAAPNLPIVSFAAADPVSMGWAQSLARPGGMITGIFQIEGTSGKRLELLKEALPQANAFGYLMNAANPGNPQFKKTTGDAALGTWYQVGDY
jgi:putative tryptophan/tyrosine transport system substrate-binding protein